MRRARAVAEAAGLRGDDIPLRNEETYHAAVTEVARTTRALVDYENRIPEFQEEYRQYLNARLCRLAGSLLAAICAGLCFAAMLGDIAIWWLTLLGPLLVAGLRSLPGSRRRAVDPAFHPRIGAAMFAAAALVAILCSTGLVIAWAAPVAPLAAWIGLRAFDLQLPAKPPGPELGTTLEYAKADR